jgi:RNase P protein component
LRQLNRKLRPSLGLDSASKFRDYALGSTDVRIINKDRDGAHLRPLTLQQIRNKMQSMKQDFATDKDYFLRLRSGCTKMGQSQKAQALHVKTIRGGQAAKLKPDSV